MIIVLDTSAAIEIVLGRKQALFLGRKVAEADWVISTALFISEVTNVFWKYHQFADMPLAACEKSIDDALAFPDEYFNENELYKEAFAMACLTKKPVYDMFFLALARRHNGYLMTLDLVLLETARKNSIRIAE